MKKVRVGIIGGAGYTGGELVRLALTHPQIELVFVQSRSQAGKLLSHAHRDLLGETALRFVETVNLAVTPVEAVFLALPHGEAAKFLASQVLPPDLRIIDLSNDFRLKKNAESGGLRFVYGLPEVFRREIKTARAVANPGCFATAIQLALLPLATTGKLKEAFVTGVTGATGAGVKLSDTSHFAFRANNIQAYKTLDHQHLGEIRETLEHVGESTPPKINFVPWRGDFTRGIFVSCIVNHPAKLSEAMKLYRDFYEGEPFVHVSESPIDLKSVVNTNKALLEIHEHDGALAIHSVLDNLLKGASGQAIQNFNLMFGFPENEGLKLKGVAF